MLEAKKPTMQWHEKNVRHKHQPLIYLIKKELFLESKKKW